MTVTEVGLMGVKPNHKVTDESTPEGQLLNSIYKNVVSLPGGPSRVYFGLETMNPFMLWAFFDWETLEEHERFAKAHGAEAVKDIPNILTHGEFTKHVTLTPSSQVLRSPVTEILLAYFPSDLSPSGKEAAMVQLQTLVVNSLNGCPDVKGASFGWGLENDFPVRGEKGRVGSVLMTLIGWPSIEASMRARETETSEKNVELVRGMAGLVELAMFHISCRTLERSTEYEGDPI